MNTMPSTAPTSADACLSIVHSLMCHRVSETGDFVYFCLISRFVVAFNSSRKSSKGENRKVLRNEPSSRW